MNPWDGVAESYGAYIDAISKEQLAHISYLAAHHADPSGDACRSKCDAWKATERHKSEVYVRHVHNVEEAVKSGIPCPW